MFRSKVRSRKAKPPIRRAHLNVERLEERTVLHSGATLFAAGITPNAALTGITLGPDNNFWFAEFDADRIGRITPTGVVTEFVVPAGRGPLNITVGVDNNLYFTENTGDRIGRINPLAGSDAAIQASIFEFIVPGVDSAPNGITSGPDGAIWFTETGSDQIGRLDIGINAITNEFAVPGIGSAPAGITTGSDGALWFTQSGSGEIGRLTTVGGMFTEFLIPIGSGGFSDPASITSGPGGHLYFTEFGADRISRITTVGALTQFDLPVGRGPQGIVALPNGDLYFTEAASSRIGRLPASALIPGRPTSGAPPLEEFDFIARDSVPLGITASRDGQDVWFTLNAGNAIGVFDAHLTQITVTATGPTIQVFDRDFAPVTPPFTPFPGYQGALSVAVSDINGNAVPDSIVGAGPGAPPHVQVFDGADNRLIASFFAFTPGFLGGISVASDDVNGDGRADIIVAAGNHIKVIDGFKVGQVQANGQIADSALLASFFAFGPGNVGSVTLSALDFNGDGRNDIIIGAGPGALPHVKVVDAAKLGQVQANGTIADSALLASFYAFTPNFTGGVFVSVGLNDVGRKLIVGAGPGAAPHVKVIDGTKFGQVQANGQIADSALLASFFAFDPSFRGGVRVAGDDINSDGQSEIMVSAGPGAGPHVKVIDGAKLNQVQPNGQIADSAVLKSFLTTNTGFTGGVFIASDADHRDGPTFGPPGITITNSRRDINDMFLFQSPVNPLNSVMVMTVSPFSSATTPGVFDQGILYDFRVVNRDLTDVTDDLVFRISFGPPDPNNNNKQDAQVRALPSALFPGVGGVLVKGFTKENLAVRGFGGTGAQFRAAEQDDPFLFDAVGFNALLNNPTAVQGVLDGDFPDGTSPNGFGPGSTPNFDAPNFFGPSVNTLSLILELPSDVLTAPGNNVIGLWGRTEFNGVQIDRMGRPAINTALIPPVPRGTGFPIGGTADLNRQDVRDAFNAGHPGDDRANFLDDMVSVLMAFYPAGRPGGVPDAPQATVLANLLLSDILVFDVTSTNGFGSVVISGGDTFVGNGRKLSDDVISTELQVLTDPDLPAGFGGGAMQPFIVTQNVRDDNGLNLTDGSFDPVSAMLRASIFPYIGSPNPNPTPVPGTPPPP